LARDVDVVVMTRADLDEQLLPAGILREPIDAARDADALLVHGTDADLAAVSATIGVDAAFRLAARYEPVKLAAPFGAPLPTGVGRRALAAAGIARPERFFAALRAEGWEVVGEIAYRDHHWFTPRDITALRQAAVDARADVVLVTEKDAVRLPADASDSGGPLWGFLPLSVAIEPTAGFAAWIEQRLAAARRRRVVEAA
jgi:tetraacyldisaccharide 4'-kinase